MERRTGVFTSRDLTLSLASVNIVTNIPHVYVIYNASSPDQWLILCDSNMFGYYTLLGILHIKPDDYKGRLLPHKERPTLVYTADTLTLLLLVLRVPRFISDCAFDRKRLSVFLDRDSGVSLELYRLNTVRSLLMHAVYRHQSLLTGLMQPTTKPYQKWCAWVSKHVLSIKLNTTGISPGKGTQI